MFNYIHSNESDVIFYEIGSVEDFLPGEKIFLEVEGTPIVIVNISGHLFAFGDVCTHDNGPLGDGDFDIEKKEIICPRHGARFDLQTGRATGLPAVKDIPVYPVRVTENKIQIGIPNT